MVRTADSRDVLVDAVVAQQACPRPRRWPTGGVSVTAPVWLPEFGPDSFLLVIGWRVPGRERPLVVLISPAARRAGRTGTWYVRAYHTRWGVEDANRGIEQYFAVEAPGPVVDVDPPAVVAGALGVLVAEPVGRGPFERLRAVLKNYPWRLKTVVTYLFDWIATMLRELLHPNQKLSADIG